jgi:Fe-Mn family superoxide dismutase
MPADEKQRECRDQAARRERHGGCSLGGAMLPRTTGRDGAAHLDEPGRPAVFFDKDGTLVEDVPYDADPARIRLAPRAAEGCARLAAAGYRLIVVSNQSGVARGYFPERALAGVATRLEALLDEAGAPLAGFYYCPHHPEGLVAAYRRRCACRKPRPGLVVRAAREHGVDLAASWLVGDILDDMEAGRRAGCRTVLIDNGNETEWRAGPFRRPDYVASDLARAAEIILGEAGRRAPRPRAGSRRGRGPASRLPHCRERCPSPHHASSTNRHGVETMTHGRVKTYKEQSFDHLKGLDGISDAQVAEHLQLYAGYVENVNVLSDELAKLRGSGRASGTNPEFAELVRHLGFEYNGMILHEYYFSNLRRAAEPKPAPGSGLAQALADSFGSVDQWRADFQAVGGMRGIGWAILFQDPATDRLSNHWISLHQDGVPAGFKPLLVMDVWEHAFMRDYKATEKGKYIEAFFRNVDWPAAERRLREDAAVRPGAA